MQHTYVIDGYLSKGLGLQNLQRAIEALCISETSTAKSGSSTVAASCMQDANQSHDVILRVGSLTLYPCSQLSCAASEFSRYVFYGRACSRICAQWAAQCRLKRGLTWYRSSALAFHMHGRPLWGPLLSASRAGDGFAGPACHPCSVQPQRLPSSSAPWQERPLLGPQMQALHQSLSLCSELGHEAAPLGILMEYASGPKEQNAAYKQDSLRLQSTPVDEHEIGPSMRDHATHPV